MSHIVTDVLKASQIVTGINRNLVFSCEDLFSSLAELTSVTFVWLFLSSVTHHIKFYACFMRLVRFRCRLTLSHKLLWSKSKFDELESSLVLPLARCTYANYNLNFVDSSYEHLLKLYVSQINAMPHTRSQRVTCDDMITVPIACRRLRRKSKFLSYLTPRKIYKRRPSYITWSQ